MIDKFGPSSVYGYTFNAVSTINGNMIPEGSKIPNLKYAPIMNIYNDDEMMVMFTSEETNMYKYGTNVHMSLSENLTKKVNAAFRKVHGSDYDKNMKSKVVDILNKTFNIDINGYVARIFGFTGTEVGDWFDDDDMENIKTSNEEYGKRGSKGLHTAFSEEELEKITTTWEYVYYVARTENLSEDFTAHSLIMFNYYYDELQRIQSMNRELGNENKSKNVDYVAQTNALNATQVSTETPPNIPPSNNANSGTSTYDRDLIKTIVSVAEFYINHIPTDSGKLKTAVSGGEVVNYENDLALNHLTSDLTEYIDANTDTIEYINDKKIKLTKTFDKNNKITAAKREFKIINETDNKQMYYDSYNYKPDEPILGHYKWKDIINNGNSYSVNTNFTGRDYTKIRDGVEYF